MVLYVFYFGEIVAFLVISITAYHQEPSMRASRKRSSQFHLLDFSHFLNLPGILSEHSLNSHPWSTFSSFHTFSPITLAAIILLPQKIRVWDRDLDAGSLFKIDPRKQVKSETRRKYQHKVHYQGHHCQDLLSSIKHASQNYPSIGWKTSAYPLACPLFSLLSAPMFGWGLLPEDYFSLSSPRIRHWDKDSNKVM